MSPRISAPNHRGLGLRFFRGGGWYRRRFDFDLGMVSRFRGRHSINVGVAGIPGTSIRGVTARASRRARRRRRARGLALGASLVLAGASLLGTVAWQQWGTSLATARAQSRLKAEFHRALAHPSKGGHTDRPVLPGGAEGLIVIPAIHVDEAFVQGVALDDLAEGPGHYPGTPLPGRGGNVAIAGHRTTHGAPFWALDSLRE